MVLPIKLDPLSNTESQVSPLAGVTPEIFSGQEGLSATMAESDAAKIVAADQTMDDSPSALVVSARRSLAFMPEEEGPEAERSSILAPMEKEAGQSANDQLTVPVADSPDIQLETIPKIFDEELFLSGKVPAHILKARASEMTEEEVHVFVDDAARAAGTHGKKLADIIDLAGPFILREREFYNQQGKRNAKGKTWTERKKELAVAFCSGVRTLERALTKMLDTGVVDYNLMIPGLTEGLAIKLDEDLLPEIKSLEAHFRTLAVSSESQPMPEPAPVIATSPQQLWELIDSRLKDAVESVLFVDTSTEFAVRLKEFANAVAASFFPGTLVEVTPAPAEN
jgi:hypothetical protein